MVHHLTIGWTAGISALRSGGQSFIFSLGKSPLDRRMLVNSTGRKWEFTFTTLVTFWRRLLCFVPALFIARALAVHIGYGC